MGESMAVAVEAGLVARHLCWVPALSHMHTYPLWASVSLSPGSCKGEKGMRAEGRWLALVLSLLFQRLKQPFWGWRGSPGALFPNYTLEPVAQLEVGTWGGCLLFPLPPVPKRLVSWTPLHTWDKSSPC